MWTEMEPDLSSPKALIYISHKYKVGEEYVILIHQSKDGSPLEYRNKKSKYIGIVKAKSGLFRKHIFSENLESIKLLCLISASNFGWKIT
jgi:hypothetical protein